MAETCGFISADIYQDCVNPIAGGTKDRLILMNLSDIDTVTYDGTNPALITAITLASAKVAYQIEGKNNSNRPLATFVRGTYNEAWTHEVQFVAFKTDAATKKQILEMTRGRLVAIVERNYKGASGASAFEVYGIACGLEVAEGTSDPQDADLMGAYNIVLRSRDDAKEPVMPAAFFDTNYATTKAKVDALLT